MKFTPAVVLFFLLSCTTSSHATALFLSEGGKLHHCEKNKTIARGLEFIGMNRGVAKATLSFWNHKKSKPSGGSHQVADRVHMGGKNDADCDYYLSAILKTGPESRPGTVVLTKNPVVFNKTVSCKESIDLMEGESHFSERARVTFNFISPQEARLSFVEEAFPEHFQNFDAVLQEGDVFWINACAYRVEKIKSKTQDMTPDPDGRYEINPPQIYCRKLDHYIPKGIDPLSPKN